MYAMLSTLNLAMFHTLFYYVESVLVCVNVFEAANVAKAMCVYIFAIVARLKERRVQ